MLDAKVLKNEILLYLPVGKKGKGAELDILELVQAIFYRLKTGCQWGEVPLQAFISRADTTWNAVIITSTSGVPMALGSGLRATLWRDTGNIWTCGV